MSSTANVWPVIGTGAMGIATCAASAVTRLAPTMRPAFESALAELEALRDEQKL